MRSLLRLMRPDSFEDISAVLALYRPGPMGANSHTNYALRKNGQQPITPIHPELAEPLADILDTTYGLIVYQEQVMAIAQRVAGYSLGKADLLRRAMRKKKKEILDKEFEPFAAGMQANGYSEKAVGTLWDILVPFSDYAFNKAHTAGYGLVSYWTAYLKANYPAEYMAALLTSVRDDKDKSALYLNECRRMGIKVLPPDVNESHGSFTPVGTDIRFGLTAIRNVGSNVVDAIVRAREEHGRFTDFGDFMNAVPVVVCN
jgi:DNA polymerase-3 subunit alpha